MIGRRCKARERLSRAPLIGRALRDTSKSTPLPTVLKTFPSSSAVRPPGRPERLPAPKQPAPQRPPGAGGHGGRGTPGPIPNPEVKPASAEGTAGATLWETRAPPAPGARCAGLGAGRRERAPGGGGPERVPLFRLRAFPAFSRRRKAADEPMRVCRRPFAFGAARLASPTSTCHAGNVAGDILILSRTSSRGNNRPGLTLRARRGRLLYIVT